MIKILSLENHKVICDIQPMPKTKIQRCEILVDSNLKILRLGVVGDILVFPEDIEPESLEEYQNAIIEFSKQQK